MSIEHFEDKHPIVAATSWIHDRAVVIGDVTLGEHVSVWPNAVIRGDVNTVTIGDNTNIQDGAVLHVSTAGLFSADGAALSIGDNVTVGHLAMLHGCTIGNNCLIGMSSTVMDDVVIEDYVMLAAGSLVTPRKRLESGYLYAGSPAKKIRELSEEEKKYFSYSAEHYVQLMKRY